MPSDYTDILGLELQETGENLNVWGERLNRALRLLDDAASFQVIALDGDLTLSNTMNVENEARKGAIAFTDAGLSSVPTVTLPPVKRLRYIENRGVAYAVNLTAGGSIGVVPPNRKVLALCDGTNVTVYDPIALTQEARIIAEQSAASASQDADDAFNSALESASQAMRLQGTSTTSNTPALGSKSFFTDPGKAFAVGTYVLIQSRNTLNRWMAGRVTSYGGAGLTVAVEAIGSVLTAGTDWDIRVSGARGPQGIPGIATLGYEARSANTQLVTADSAHWYDLTGTFTQTFAAASAIGADWYVVLKNAGTGDITLDPNGSETIDGLTSFVMYPGEVRLIQCDGTTFRSVVLTPFYKVFTASGTFIKPPGYSAFGAILRGGGGGGGKGNGSVGGQGGGPGAVYGFPLVPALALSSTSTVAIGAGGLGATTSGGNGGAGGSTSIGTLSAGGGGAGPAGQGPVNPLQSPAAGGAESYASGRGGGKAVGATASDPGGGGLFGFTGGAAGVGAASGGDGAGVGAGGGGTEGGARGGNGVAGDARIWGLI